MSPKLASAAFSAAATLAVERDDLGFSPEPDVELELVDTGASRETAVWAGSGS
jgi:hypothetical protein